jgi:hypothetical protein
VDEVQFEKRMRELSQEFSTLNQEAHDLENKIKNDWKKIL